LQNINSNTKFYDKYWYKLEICNSLAHIFREKNFAYAQSCLETIEQDYNVGKELLLKRAFITTPISISNFLDAKVLYNSFMHNQEDYAIRVASPTIGIYSNNKDWLFDINKKIKTESKFYQPLDCVKTLLGTNTPVVIVKRPIPYKYRVTLKNRVPPEFAKWIATNQTKIKIGSTAYDHINKNGWAHGYYFYVTTEKVLSLLSILIGANIQRVEEVVVDPNIDK
tara:strand:- start:249 stop:920 length:672 start_codon:yes stop_codon:yes gene_type:complete